ncbi:MAG: hypothetical protein LBC20_07795 [Planctomycetaceae bacterium]|jgi:hypothetical protein|nr:hypothetical protein [Planctomycetaceae bacterium]
MVINLSSGTQPFDETLVGVSRLAPVDGRKWKNNRYDGGFIIYCLKPFGEMSQTIIKGGVTN